MSSSAYSASAHASSSSVDHTRPRSIAELASLAQLNLWDPSKPLKHWLRTAEKARKVGSQHVEAGNLEAAFIEFARAATIVLDRLPSHSEYHALLNADQRANLAANGQDIMDQLSRIKPRLVERYDNWRVKHEANGGTLQPVPDAIQEAARKKREEQLRAEEMERARQALEAAQLEDEWRLADLTRKEEEERLRRVQAERDWARQARDARMRDMSEAQRAAEAREAAEQERASRWRGSEDPRRSSDDERRDEEMLRRRVEERRRQEQEGILRRQQEAQAAADEVRRQIASSSTSSVQSRGDPNAYIRRSQQVETPTRAVPRDPSLLADSPQSSRPPSGSQQYPYNAGPPTMPIENPAHYEDDTDVEASRAAPWSRSRPSDHAQPRVKPANTGLVYPPPVTTTSPAPPDLGPIRYPTLMSQHQLKQGYVPSLQSMFSHTTEPPSDSAALLLETKPGGALYANLLPKPSTPAPVIPPYVPGMPVPGYPQSYGARNMRGPSPSSSRAPPPVKDPVIPPPPAPPSAPRIVRGASTESDVKELKSVKLPRECLNRFVSIARLNTAKNKETCGLLLGKDKGNKYVVTTLLIPKQHSTSDTCSMDEEELVLQFTEERHLITLGWIHTHPTQSCFMSSVDLHTHSGFQRMLPESFAVVCAPNSTPSFGIFRLTDPGGLQVILKCQAKEAFHPHPEVPIYTDCDNSHVQMKDIALEIVDLRET